MQDKPRRSCGTRKQKRAKNTTATHQKKRGIRRGSIGQIWENLYIKINNNAHITIEESELNKNP